MSKRPARLRRSQLAVPGVSEKMLTKAAASNADHVFCDLEDAVAPSAKPGARDTIADALNGLDWGKTVRCVRVNDVGTEWCFEDIITIVEKAGENLDTIMLPKPMNASDVQFADKLLSQLEKKLKLKNRIGLEVLIEEVEAMQNVVEIANSCERLECMIFGMGDYAASQGLMVKNIGDHRRLSRRYFPLPQISNDNCRPCSRIDAVDGPFANFKNEEAYKQECTRALTLGMVGKWAIHPAQIEPALEVFSPAQKDVDFAREIIQVYRKAEAEGIRLSRSQRHNGGRRISPPVSEHGRSRRPNRDVKQCLMRSPMLPKETRRSPGPFSLSPLFWICLWTVAKDCTIRTGPNGIDVAAGLSGDADVILKASQDDWAKFVSAKPPVGYQALSSMAESGHLKLELRDAVKYFRHSLMLEKLFGSLRSTVATNVEPYSQIEIEPVTGRYLRLNLQGRPHRLYFEEAGEGIPLLCLHTAGSDGRQYRALMNDPEVTKHFRVIAFDLPRHGKSAPPPGFESEPYMLTTDVYVDTIVEVVRALNLDQPVVMGCSIGGRAVLHLALRHGDSFRAAIGLQSAMHAESKLGEELGLGELYPLHRPDVHGGEASAASVMQLMSSHTPTNENGKRFGTTCRVVRAFLRETCFTTLLTVTSEMD